MTDTIKQEVRKEFKKRLRIEQLVNLKRPHTKVYHAAAEYQVLRFLEETIDRVREATIQEVLAAVPSLDEIADNFTEHRSGDWVREQVLSAIKSND